MMNTPSLISLMPQEAAPISNKPQPRSHAPDKKDEGRGFEDYLLGVAVHRTPQEKPASDARKTKSSETSDTDTSSHDEDPRVRCRKDQDPTDAGAAAVRGNSEKVEVPTRKNTGKSSKEQTQSRDPSESESSDNEDGTTQEITVTHACEAITSPIVTILPVPTSETPKAATEGDVSDPETTAQNGAVRTDAPFGKVVAEALAKTDSIQSENPLPASEVPKTTAPLPVETPLPEAAASALLSETAIETSETEKTMTDPQNASAKVTPTRTQEAPSTKSDAPQEVSPIKVVSGKGEEASTEQDAKSDPKKSDSEPTVVQAPAANLTKNSKTSVDASPVEKKEIDVPTEKVSPPEPKVGKKGPDLKWSPPILGEARAFTQITVKEEAQTYMTKASMEAFNEIGTQPAQNKVMPEVQKDSLTPEAAVIATKAPNRSEASGTTSAKATLSNFMDRVRQAVEAQTPPRPKSLTFELEPQALGKVHLEMQWTSKGWTVQWSVSNRQVQEWIAHQLPSLQQSPNSTTPIVWHAPTLQGSPFDLTRQQGQRFQREGFADNHLPEEEEVSVSEEISTKPNEYWA